MAAWDGVRQCCRPGEAEPRGDRGRGGHPGPRCVCSSCFPLDETRRPPWPACCSNRRAGVAIWLRAQRNVHRRRILGWGHDRPGRAGSAPPSRVRVVEHDATGDHEREDVVAAEEPLEIRIAWPGAGAARLGDHADAGPRLRAGRRLGVPRGAGRGRRPWPSVAYCTDEDLAPEQEFNVVTLRSADRSTWGTAMTRCPAGSVGLRGLREGQHRGGAHHGARCSLGRPAAQPRRRTPAAGAAARGPVGVRAHRWGPCRRPVHRGRRAARRTRGRGAAQRRRQGHRSPAARGRVPVPRVPRGERPGRVRAGAEGRGRGGRVAGRRWARRPRSPSTWRARRASASSASPAPSAPSATPDRRVGIGRLGVISMPLCADSA